MFYTYAHVTADTNKLFYIGKGVGRRMYRKEARNTHWHNTVLKHGYVAIKLADWKTSQEAFDHEKVLIASFRDMGYKLVNQSGGGDGNDASGGLSFKGKTHKPSAKEKCRLANINKVISEEAKQKISKANNSPLLVNCVRYNSWNEVSIVLGIPKGSISRQLKTGSDKWSHLKIERVM